MYKEAYERAVATNAAVARNNELASTVEFEPLEAKLYRLLDELLQKAEGDIGAAQASPIKSPDLRDRAVEAFSNAKVQPIGLVGTTDLFGERRGNSRVGVCAFERGDAGSSEDWVLNKGSFTEGQGT